MKYTGRIIGVSFTTGASLFFASYFYFRFGRLYQVQLIGGALTSVFTWWLCGFYDKAQYYSNELMKSKEELKHIFKSVAAAIWQYDFRTRTALYSQGVAKMLGFSSDTIIRDPFPWFDMVHPDDHEIINQFCDEFLKAKHLQYQFRIIPPDEKLRWVECRGTPILDSDGSLVKVVGVIMDITDSKMTEEFVRRTDKLHMIGELASGVAHEIRNPLTSIRGFVQLLEPQISNKKYSEVMLGELDRINQIVSEFMALAKPHSNQYKPAEIFTLIQSTIVILQPQLNLHNIEVKMESSSTTLIVLCEENQLKQVFINIIKNATEAMPNGGKIIARIESDEKNVVISFIDQGCGIDKQTILKLGTPFFTTKESGTGLGLMVSQKIVQNHKGSLTIESEMNKGTTVTIAIPRYVMDKLFEPLNSGNSLKGRESIEFI